MNLAESRQITTVGYFSTKNTKQRSSREFCPAVLPQNCPQICFERTATRCHGGLPLEADRYLKLPFTCCHNYTEIAYTLTVLYLLCVLVVLNPAQEPIRSFTLSHLKFKAALLIYIYIYIRFKFSPINSHWEVR